MLSLVYHVASCPHSRQTQFQDLEPIFGFSRLRIQRTGHVCPSPGHQPFHLSSSTVIVIEMSKVTAPWSRSCCSAPMCVGHTFAGCLLSLRFPSAFLSDPDLCLASYSVWTNYFDHMSPKVLTSLASLSFGSYPQLVLLRCNWHTAMCKFQVYGIMIWLTEYCEMITIIR